jgi:hypothetical protein
MELMKNAISFLLWTARLLSVLLLALFCVFLVGEGPPPFLKLSVLETIEFSLLLLSLAGLVIAFRREALGGVLGLAGGAGFF